MKKKFLALLMAVACMILPLVGCGKDECVHVDADKDGKCDNCEETISCETHADANGDLVCDVCGSATAVCDAHVDEDKNLSCDKCGATLTGGCDPHKDDNADSFCDACGGAIVYQTQVAAPKEEARVDMVVNTVPADVEIGQYMDVSATIKPLWGAAIEGAPLSGHEKFFLVKDTDEETGLDSYTLTNVLSGAVVLQLTETEPDTMSVNYYDYYIRVTVTNELGEKTDSYYWYSDKAEAPFATETFTDSRKGFSSSSLNNGCRIYKMDEVGYIFDTATKELLFANVDLKTFVDRPTFDEMTDAYGYVRSGDTILAYNLSAWIDCVYSYTIPSYFEDVAQFTLNNGTVLVQASVALPSFSVSYDYIDGNGKHDLVYVIVDPAAKTATEVEFGYYIEIATGIADVQFYSENAANGVVAYEIVNDRIDTNVKRTFITDDSLKILADLGVMKMETGMPTFLPNGLMVLSVELGAREQAVYTLAGEFVCYLPTNATLYRNYVKYNGQRYSHRMELLPDVTEDGYVFAGEYYNYALLSKLNEETEVTEYFYYDGANITPITADGEIAYVLHGMSGFAVVYEQDGETLYACYDAANRLVMTTYGRPTSVQDLGTDTVVSVVYAQNDGYYLVK